MPDKVLHLFVRRFPGVGYSAHVLGQPHLASFGEKLADVRTDLSIVCAKLFAREELHEDQTHWPNLKLRRAELVLRAMQRGRLLSVPMRFSVLTRPELTERPTKAKAAPTGPVRVFIPRLSLEESLHDAGDLDLFLEEVIRHRLHLAPLEELLEVAYDGEESVETLTVTAKALRPAARRQEPARKPLRAPLPSGLSEACRRLGDEVEVGTLERAFQRDAELGELMRALAEPSRTSVLLVGPPTVGKTSLVHELAERVSRLSPGHPLHGLHLYSTSGGRLVAGMRYLGEWQDRVKRMIASLRTHRAVLHLDSLAELLQAIPGSDEDGLDIARQLVPSMEAGEISVLCEATPEDAARAERTHSGFLQAMQRLVVAPLAPAAARVALTSAAHRVGRARKVQFDEEAIERAIDLVERFGEAGGIPGVAVDLLRSAARRAPTVPAGKVRRMGSAEVTHAFLDRTGYPREIVDPEVPLDPEAVLQKLQARVVGQSEAVLLLRNLVVTLKTGMCDPARPLGAYLLLGPTGVGKTESALSLAAYLFGDEKRLTRFDMAEYAAPGSAQRLVGGYGARAGSLTARVREQPFGVVLLDEIEKADGSVHDLLLQLLGEGRLTDSAGRTVSFRNTVVLLTSNLGADTLGRNMGFARGSAADERAHYVGAATAFFRPELINRLDQIVPYHALRQEALRTIAARALAQALEREGLTRRRVKVTFSQAVVDRLAELGFDARYGARPLKRAIEQHAIAPIAQLLARAGDSPPAALELTVDEGGKLVARELPRS